MGLGRRGGAIVDVANIAWRDLGPEGTLKTVPAEVAVALTYDGTTQAVMMMTPADLEDFAVGFSLADGIVSSVGEILAIEPHVQDLGIDLRIHLSEASGERPWTRRRTMAGPVGCGLCGLDSLKAMRRPLPPVTATARFSPDEMILAMQDLWPRQLLNQRTRAMHAAAFCGAGGIEAIREDVGRHNALDKLNGAMARSGRDMARGFVLMTSRLSVDLIEKIAMANCGMVVAASAPTALAIQAATDAGLTLVGMARGEDFDVFTHPWRISQGG